MGKNLEQRLLLIVEDATTLAQKGFKEKYGVKNEEFLDAVTTLETALLHHQELHPAKRIKLECISDEELRKDSSSLTLNEMSNRYSCSVSTIAKELSKRGISKEYVSTKSRRLKQVSDEYLARDAATLTLMQMAEKYRTSHQTIYSILIKRGIKKQRIYAKNQMLSQVSDQEIKDASEVFSMKEIEEYYGVNYSLFSRELRNRGLGRKKFVYSLEIQEKERKRLDVLKDALHQGATLQQIGDKLGVTRERARQLVAKYNLRHPKELRKERKRGCIQAVYNYVCQRLEQKLETAPQAERYTIQYLEKTNSLRQKKRI